MIKKFVVTALAVFFTVGASQAVSGAQDTNDQPQTRLTCNNQVFKTTRIVPMRERNDFLVSAMEQFKAQKQKEGVEPTEVEIAALIEQIRQTAPVEEVITTVFSDNPSLLPAPELDPSDGKWKRFKDERKFDKFAEKVRQTKCRTNTRANGSPQSTVVSMTTTAAWSPTWYYCTAEAYAKNLTGQKIIRLVQRQDWLVSIYGTVQDYDPVDVETYAYLSWRASGATSIVGPRWLTQPWQLYSSAKQKFVNSFKVYDIQTRYLSTALTVGPADQCIMSPGKGPGMP